jgi:TolB-like protein
VRLRDFFAELQRRNVYKVAAAYLVIAWLTIQAASIVFPTFEVPAWVMKVLLVAVVLGFVIALILAWAFELTAEGFVRLEESLPNNYGARRTGRKLTAAIVVLAVLASGLFALKMLGPKRTTTNSLAPSQVASASLAISDKSIAVLPFKNLSEDKSNTFLATGIQDEILTSLAKLSGLKVMSRTSTTRYESAPQDLSRIAQELHVANIVEGSVQKAGDKVHINVQLIRADTETHLWAQSYDGGLADIFGFEVEVAQSVADALQAVISPEEKARVQSRPTENADAYVLYLRAREYHTRPTGLLQDYQMADRLYTQAVTLDPAFALAHARLSAALAYVYLNFQPTDEIKSRARAEAEEALRLQPDLAEGRLAYGLCLYWTEKNYAAALRELEIAGRLLPNNVEVEFFASAIHRRQGQWSEAIAGMERAASRDPRNALLAREVLLTEWMVRDWAAAARGGDRAVALAPDLPLLRVERSYVDIWSRGDLAPLRAALAAVPSGLDPDGEVTLARWDAALLERDFEGAERLVTGFAGETVLTTFGTPLPKSYLLGCIAFARGEPQRAKPLFEAARSTLETEANSLPNDAFRQAQLGLLYAFLGQKEDALRHGRRAVELVPESKDALNGPCLAGLFALICARIGDADQAVTLLQHLLTIPGPISQVFEGSITLSELRLRWQWDPLRNDSRFQKIVTGSEPKTVY